MSEYLNEPNTVLNDALSDVLSLIRVCQNTVFTCAASAPFGIYFPSGTHRLHIIRSGQVAITVDGEHEPLYAEKGDIVMLMKGHMISDQPNRPTRTLSELAQSNYDPKNLMIGQGTNSWLCGNFGFDGVMAEQLLSALPPVLILHQSNSTAYKGLDMCCQMIIHEALHPQVGSVAMISRFMDVLFVQMIRIWASENNVNKGWLSGVLDVRLNKAITAMHLNPEKAWNVDDLAAYSNMSKSAFTERFHRIIGQAPLSYLNNWRLDRASELLRYGHLTIAEVASQVGYSSDSAFSRSFKARFGMSPLKWKRNTTLVEAVHDNPAEGLQDV